MNIYIAAPWKHRGDMPDVAALFEQAGHNITHKWWEAEEAKESERSALILKQQAYNDVAGVKRADVVIVINSAKSEGKALEQGIAIADGKRIVAVGTRGEFSANVFHYLDNYTWVNTIEEAVNAIRI